METIRRASPLPFDLDGYLLATLQRVQRLVPFDSGGLVLFSPASNTLVPHAYLGAAALLVPRTPTGQGIIGQVAASGVPLIVNDMRADPHQQVNLASERPDMAARLLTRLAEWRQARVQEGGAPDPLEARVTTGPFLYST